jgi:ferredoxin
MLVPDLHERATLACGPGGLLDALQAHHDARGLDLLTEQFRVTTLVAGEGGTVGFTGSSSRSVRATSDSGTTVDADGATPILDAAEAAGVLMPSGCRMGICFGCVLPLKEGAVRDLRTGAVTTATPGETEGRGVPIQTCISAAAGPCVIDH